MVKVVIDREGCISCANCWTVCPEFFEQSPDDDKSRIIEKYRTGSAPGEGETVSDNENCVKTASEECPVQVIHVYSSPG